MGTMEGPILDVGSEVGKVKPIAEEIKPKIRKSNFIEAVVKMNLMRISNQ